jgi:CxxC-x17-CxxC domain-containing protein
MLNTRGLYNLKTKKEINNMYREGSSGGRFDGPPREMHKVTCAECGKETEVPFKPDGSRPVYCKDCYQKHRPKRF